MTNTAAARDLPQTLLRRLCFIALMFALLGCANTTVAESAAQTPAAAPPSSNAAQATSAAKASPLRVMAWNVSNDAFVRDPAAFRALVAEADADVLLLDEVAPATNQQQIRKALAGLKDVGSGDWHIDSGRSGGRQRNVIVSRLPLESVPEFAEIVRYPEADKQRLLGRMRAVEPSTPAFVMDSGIPVNGAVVLDGSRRLLVVSIDLQCCGNDPASWEEERRRIEVVEIRQRIRRVLERTRVDGIILAGDFNLVSTALPLLICAGPYPAPHGGLIAAELYHRDGQRSWTWDGTGTEFPSRAMDFLLYSANSLVLGEGYILDSADLAPAKLEQLKLGRDSIGKLSDHRPLIVELRWQ